MTQARQDSEPPLLTTDVITSVENTETDLAIHLRTLPAEKQRAFLSLHNNFPGQGNPLTSIIRSNGYPLGADAGCGGVFENISRINHGCLPNAVQNWNGLLGEEGEETVYAIKDIKEGEEITTSYLSGGTSKERRAVLKQSFGFDCTCKLCDSDEADLKASDERLSRIQELHIDIGDSETVRHDPEKALGYCKELLEILEVEGIKDDRVTAMHSDAARAAWWAKKFCEAKVISAGKSCIDRLDMKPFTKRPQKHDCFGAFSVNWKTKLEELPKERAGEEFEKWLWRE
ncbi:putative SET domain-containing protein 5 [Glarea lozoyensis 74030]|uniref:Putative SET domain-containing protein 5 n=1 Tax=Glarea lozoyensis (strain ATCC 74030 / MF5533) TaxID=1104152 RepID=H0EJB2_GLAL7|nr:putative SET domain-containing protein 5 [Glarea lozoyensis 74030]